MFQEGCLKVSGDLDIQWRPDISCVFMIINVYFDYVLNGLVITFIADVM